MKGGKRERERFEEWKEHNDDYGLIHRSFSDSKDGVWMKIFINIVSKPFIHHRTDLLESKENWGGRKGGERRGIEHSLTCNPNNNL